MVYEYCLRDHITGGAIAKTNWYGHFSNRKFGKLLQGTRYLRWLLASRQVRADGLEVLARTHTWVATDLDDLNLIKTRYLDQHMVGLRHLVLYHSTLALWADDLKPAISERVETLKAFTGLKDIEILFANCSEYPYKTVEDVLSALLDACTGIKSVKLTQEKCRRGIFCNCDEDKPRLEAIQKRLNDVLAQR